jgi:two-component system sensor histidine kinase/response regulator
MTLADCDLPWIPPFRGKDLQANPRAISRGSFPKQNAVDADTAKEKTTAMQQASSLPQIPGLNVEPAVKRLAGSVKLYMKTLKKMHAALPEQGQKIRDAYAAGDFEVLRRELHTLKGLAATVGADELAEINARLEGLAAGLQLPEPSAMHDLQVQIDSLHGTLGALSFD